jgi:hypothetical protein
LLLGLLGLLLRPTRINHQTPDRNSDPEQDEPNKGDEYNLGFVHDIKRGSNYRRIISHPWLKPGSLEARQTHSRNKGRETYSTMKGGIFGTLPEFLGSSPVF